MPNGNPNFEKEELPLLEAFFAKISSVLEDFSSSHNMQINKYYHEGPSWAFMFKHPVNGTGQIEVEKVNDNFVLIRKSWTIDDFDTSTRFLKYPPPSENIGLDHIELHQALEEALAEILKWKKEDLTPLKVPHSWSKHCSKEQFYRQYENLPVLRKN
ncbi:MAG: hypothetical protein ACYSWP_09110 [Planctomycetota bacterium]|jgi:hypothetical protein